MTWMSCAGYCWAPALNGRTASTRLAVRILAKTCITPLPAGLLLADVDVLEDLSEVRGFLRDDLVEVVRPVGGRDHELRLELRLHVRRLQRCRPVRRNLVEDVLRHACGGEQ